MRHAATSIQSAPFPFSTPSVTAASRMRVLAARIRWLVCLPGRVAALRRDLAMLGGMSACELADIGLARQDLWDAAALPFGHAPGPLLARRAAERRRAALSRRS